MNFPLDNPVFQFLYWLMDTPGLGSIALIAMIAALLTIFVTTLRWISRSAQLPEVATYAYPTPALHAHRQEGEK